MTTASIVTVAGQTKQFTAEESQKAMRSCNFIGAVVFWREIQRLARPEEKTRFHAMGVLRAFAERSYEDCGGIAFSPQQAECFEFCGLTPVGICAPGVLGR